MQLARRTTVARWRYAHERGNLAGGRSAIVRDRLLLPRCTRRRTPVVLRGHRSEVASSGPRRLRVAPCNSYLPPGHQIPAWPETSIGGRLPANQSSFATCYSYSLHLGRLTCLGDEVTGQPSRCLPVLVESRRTCHHSERRDRQSSGAESCTVQLAWQHRRSSRYRNAKVQSCATRLLAATQIAAVAREASCTVQLASADCRSRPDTVQEST